MAGGKSCMLGTHGIFIIVLPTVSIRVLHPDLPSAEQKGHELWTMIF